MGKSKRNRSNHDKRRAAEFTLDEAQQDVADAEAVLAAARRKANIAAAAARGVQRARRQKLGNVVKRANERVDLDLGTAAPEDQASAFFNRPGDYFLARFTITEADGIVGPTAEAETVLKADESQFDYLLEVLRQIRGGFGTRCRIELHRTHTNEAPTGGGITLEDVTAAAEEAMTNRRRRIADGPPRDMSEFHLGERRGANDPEFVDYVESVKRNGNTVPPWIVGGPTDDELALGRDLTREELAAQLPGKTRAEVADELGKDPASLGDRIDHAGDMTREQIAAEMGVPVERVRPLPMRGGGFSYAIDPEPDEPAGRHSAGDDHGPTVELAIAGAEAGRFALVGKAWVGPGWYVVRPATGDARNVHAGSVDDLFAALNEGDVEAYKARQIADRPQA